MNFCKVHNVGAEAADLQTTPTTTGPEGPVVLCKAADYFKALKRTRLGLAPSSPRRFFLSASYSW
jgi:hypothetical protein